MLSPTSVTLRSCLKKKAATPNIFTISVGLTLGSYGGCKKLILNPWGRIMACKFLVEGASITAGSASKSTQLYILLDSAPMKARRHIENTSMSL